MIRNENNKYNQPQYILYPGDYYAVTENSILSSVAGATVLVCLYDLKKQIGGMGHFIVPGTLSTKGIIVDEIARHGIQSMELLIGEIVKKGGDRRYLKAKLFGAGYIKESIPDMGGVQQSNIKFLHEYFSLEKIQVVKEDLGGDRRRKVNFFPMKGIAYRKFQRRNEDSSEFIKMEKEYIDSVFRNRNKTGMVVLFE
jgi:chemotaxis protein CheD